MNYTYENWLERERNWINEAEMKIRKSMSQYAVLEILGCAGGFAAIGLLSGAGVRAVLQNLGIGLVLGVVVAVITVLAIRASLPASKYMESLKELMEGKLSETERNEFASQMMDENAKCVSWINAEEKIEYRIHITRDYLLYTSARGGADLIKLQQVERIELDAKESVQRIRSNGIKITIRETDYPMFFYFKNSGEVKGENPDDVIYFPQRNLRDEAVKYIGNTEDKNR